MQNAECRNAEWLQRGGVLEKFILHSAFCILHCSVEDQGLPVHLRWLLQATQTGRPVWGPDAFKCSAEVNSASAKIFACGKNACTARSAARPLGGMALEKKKTSI